MSASNPQNTDARLATLSAEHYAATREEVAQIIADLPARPGIDNNQLLLETLAAISEARDKDGNPALKVCSRAQIINAVVSNVAKGLSPALDQVYPIVKGTQLIMQRSVFGDLALVKAQTGYTAYTRVVLETDEFKTKIKYGKEYITVHESDPRSTSLPGGAYVGLLDAEGNDLGIHYMNLDRIRRSWQMSIPYRFAMEKYEAAKAAGKEDKKLLPPHEIFLEDFMLRTVVRAGLKWILKTQGASAARALKDITEIVDGEDIIDADFAEEANSVQLDASGLDEIQDTGE